MQLHMYLGGELLQHPLTEHSLVTGALLLCRCYFAVCRCYSYNKLALIPALLAGLSPITFIE